MAESVMISLGVTSKNLDAELQKTKGKFQKLNQSVMSEGASKNITAMKNSLSGLGKMGDSLGGMFGKIAGGFSSLLSPVGLLTAGIGLAITASVNLYKKLTLSHEQYIAYLEHTMQRSQAKLSNVDKQEQTDNGYFERLKELNQAQTLSNSIKTETITIIQLLTRRYGDLGLSIDETTGKIIGLDNAFDRFQERVGKLKLEELKNQAEIAKRIANEQEKNVSKIGVERDYQISNSRSFEQVMTPEEKKDFNSGDPKRRKRAMDAAIKREQERFAKMPMDNASQDTLAEYKNVKERMANLEAKRQNDVGVLPYNEQQEYDELQARQEALEKIIKLEYQLFIAEEKIRQTASDPQTNKKWKDYASALQNAILMQKNFNLEASKQQQGQQGRLRRAREAAIAQQKMNLKTQNDNTASEASVQREREARQQYDFSRMDKADQMTYYRKKNQERNAELTSYKQIGKSQKSSAQDIDLSYGKVIADLEDKERNKTISDDEKKTLKMYRTIFGNRINAYKASVAEFNKVQEQIKKAQREHAKRLNKPVQDWTDTEYEDFRQKHTSLLAQRDRIGISMNVSSKNYDELKKRQEELTARQKKGPLTASEFDELLEVNKQIVAIEATIASTKKTQAEIAEQITKTEIKRLQIQNELNDTFKNGKSALDAELALQQAIARGNVKAIERQKIINALKAKGYDLDKLKKQGINVDSEIDSYVDKKMDLDKQKFIHEQTQNIDRQITLESMKLQGLFDEIELQKLLNQLQDKKIQLDKKQIDAIMAKKKQLQTVQFSNLIKDQTDGLLQSVQSQINKKQAQADKRIKEYQKKYGKLNQDQKDAVKSIVDMEFEIAKVQNEKVDFSHNEIKTNSLTKRGGFSGGVVMSRMETINEKISANATKQVQLLTNIKALIQDLKNAGII